MASLLESPNDPHRLVPQVFQSSRGLMHSDAQQNPPLYK
jgi:hypothetical protein